MTIIETVIKQLSRFIMINENVLVNEGYFKCRVVIAKRNQLSKAILNQVLKTILKVYLQKVSAKLNVLAIFSSCINRDKRVHCMLRFSHSFNIKLAFIKALFLSSFCWFSELTLYRFIRVQFRRTMQKRNVEAVPGEDVESRYSATLFKKMFRNFFANFQKSLRISILMTLMTLM